MKMKACRPRTREKARGAAMVEFVVVLAFFYIPAMLITFDYGRVFFSAMSVTSAAHALALYGANGYWASGGLPTITNTQALEAEPNLGTTVEGLGVTSRLMYKCPTDTKYQTTIPTCIAPATPYVAVNVRVSAVFETVVNYSYIPHTIPLNSETLIRVR